MKGNQNQWDIMVAGVKMCLDIVFAKLALISVIGLCEIRTTGAQLQGRYREVTWCYSSIQSFTHWLFRSFVESFVYFFTWLFVRALCSFFRLFLLSSFLPTYPTTFYFLMRGFLSNFSCGFPWAICSDFFWIFFLMVLTKLRLGFWNFENWNFNKIF